MIKAYASGFQDSLIDMKNVVLNIRNTGVQDLYVLYFNEEKDYFKFKMKFGELYDFITTSKIEAIEKDPRFLSYFGVEEINDLEENIYFQNLTVSVPHHDGEIVVNNLPDNLKVKELFICHNVSFFPRNVSGRVLDMRSKLGFKTDNIPRNLKTNLIFLDIDKLNDFFPSDSHDLIKVLKLKQSLIENGSNKDIEFVLKDNLESMVILSKDKNYEDNLMLISEEDYEEVYNNALEKEFPE